MTEYALEVRSVSKSFPGTKALDNVQFKLRKGSVHALVGENGAGKSTLMKCLLGIYIMDAGEVYIKGKRVIPTSVKQMHKEGLSIIQQELAPVYARSVMENIWLGREPMKGPFVDHHTMYRRTKELLEKFKFDIDPRTPIGKLTVAQIQMVEIVKAVSWDVDVVMMDEPTSSLTNREIEQLFEIIEGLRDAEISVIYVSHKMDEIKQIADEVTVFRDGQYIASHLISEVTIDEIIHEMVGRKIDDQVFCTPNKVMEEAALHVEQLSDGQMFDQVSFTLKKGEVLGFAGLVGAGRTEVLETIFGLRKRTEDTVEVFGNTVEIRNPRQAARMGLAMLTEERRKDGIIGCLNIMENMLVANYDTFVDKLGFVMRKKGIEATNAYIKKLNIKTPNWTAKIMNLSGGNQQKVLLARWLLSDPDILFLDEPTRGIDVGAKAEIYQIIDTLATNGKSIIIVSSEMPELLKVCDRILVMSEGHVVGELTREEASQEAIMALASIKSTNGEVAS